jgi:hypothetical protein
MMIVHIFEVELGAAFLVVWLASIVAMWFLVDRTTRPGVIRGVAVIETMMLLSILSLLLGISLSIWGAGLAD